MHTYNITELSSENEAGLNSLNFPSPIDTNKRKRKKSRALIANKFELITLTKGVLIKNYLLWDLMSTTTCRLQANWINFHETFLLSNRAKKRHKRHKKSS